MTVLLFQYLVLYCWNSFSLRCTSSSTPPAGMAFFNISEPFGQLHGWGAGGVWVGINLRGYRSKILVAIQSWFKNHCFKICWSDDDSWEDEKYVKDTALVWLWHRWELGGISYCQWCNQWGRTLEKMIHNSREGNSGLNCFCQLYSRHQPCWSSKNSKFWFVL